MDKWIDVLPKLIDNYNNTIHRSIKMKPINVKNEDQKKLQRILYPPAKAKSMQLILAIMSEFQNKKRHLKRAIYRVGPARSLK